MSRGVSSLLLAAAVLAAACSGDDTSPASPDESTSRTASNGTPSESSAEGFDDCDWPTWGYTAGATFATECESEIDADSASRLALDWFFDTADVVTATPAVVDGVVYVGDWSGRFYAIDAETGRQQWSYQTEIHPTVYSGQIVSSAAVADTAAVPDRTRIVVFGGGRSVYALDATTGDLVWRHDVRPDAGEDDPSEVQTSPVVVDDKVVFGFDGHDSPGVPAGVKALDLASGDELWYFDPDEGGEPAGCAGVWGSPSVDVERRHVYFGTANCPTSPEGWNRYSEAMIAVDLDTGEPVWSYQPHPPNNDDTDFAGAPNLFESNRTDAVGLGNKDGSYYAVDRDSGELLWKVDAAPARITGRNYSTGGFIGPTAVAGDVIVGATAVGGDCPCLHGIGVDGELVWQQSAAGPSFSATTAVNDVALVGSTTDFTLRAVRIDDGEVLWRYTMPGAVAGGAAITADRVVAVSGIREPGTEAASETSGVSAFVVAQADESTTSTPETSGLPPTTMAPPTSEVSPAVPGDTRSCVAQPCDMSFTLKEPPPGAAPRIWLHVDPEPFRIEIRSDGLGEPNDWIRPDSDASKAGAVAFAAFLSVSDDNPVGALVCVLDGEGDCVSEVLPEPLADSYNRLSILAIEDSTDLPEPAEGFDRMVTTESFSPPLELG